MKRFLLFPLFILSCFLFQGCAEMGAAMSNATANNCIRKSSIVSVYSTKSDKYLEDTIFYMYNGKDYTYYEKAWVASRQNYYLDYYTFGVWYEESPYTKADYRFSTLCVQYNNSY